MSSVDWLVLVATLALIVVYGLYKSRASKDLDGYFLSNRSMPWYLILLSIMGTQASAVTFLSAPGQAFTDGMRFVQYYFGLPVAMVVLCITFVPIFSKLKVYTAYEFLEQRFDLPTRILTSSLFLLQRGLSTGLSIYAPSIILSTLLGWDIYLTNVVMGGLLIIYTVSGGARAVAYTQQLQMIIIFAGMALAGYTIVHQLPDHVSFTDAIHISGASGKMNVITTGMKQGRFNWSDKYNIWSGLIGGFFLALSYFGTDQSQVGRYLTAKNVSESKVGLLMNGLVKVPMQFFILLIGALLFTFYQFVPAPLFHNKVVEQKALQTRYRDTLQHIGVDYRLVSTQQQQLNNQYLEALHASKPTLAALKKKVQQNDQKLDTLRAHYKNFISKAVPAEDSNDTNYIFIRFVFDYMHPGLVGLLVAIIFLASWGSVAAALNSLASCSMIDFHLRLKKDRSASISEEDCLRDYKQSRLYTLGWGIFCIIVAQFANRMGSLIEAVNVLGSLFYGVMLGIFLVAFYLKRIGGRAVFWSAIISEVLVVLLFILNENGVIDFSFLWLNAAGALLVVAIACLFSALAGKKKETVAA